MINDEKNLTLIHYTGNDTLATEFPHCSAKTKASYSRTLPSYLKSTEEKLKLSKASVLYSKEISRLNNDVIAGPRNVQQFRNLRFKVLSEE